MSLLFGPPLALAVEVGLHLFDEQHASGLRAVAHWVVGEGDVDELKFAGWRKRPPRARSAREPLDMVVDCLRNTVEKLISEAVNEMCFSTVEGMETVSRHYT